jgi:CheY-like chemotaxis protein
MNAPDRQDPTPQTAPEGEMHQPIVGALHTPGASADSSARRTVLVVENDEQSRRLIEQILAFSEYACLSAANGVEALEKLNQAHIDLALMDLSMPALDGYQTVELLRARPEYASIPVVAVSGYTEETQRDHALEAGFTDYLSKPFRPKELLQLINRLLSDTAQRTDGAMREERQTLDRFDE